MEKGKRTSKKRKKKASSLENTFPCKVNTVRRHRQTIYLNDNEMAAVRMYCERYRVSSRSALFREAVMKTIISVIDESQPTLF